MMRPPMPIIDGYMPVDTRQIQYGPAPLRPGNRWETRAEYRERIAELAAIFGE